MRRKSLGVIVLIALVLTACGGGEAEEVEVEVGDDEPVLQITAEGGFVPVEVALNNGPRFTLLGDGRLIYQGVQTMEFPGRLVPPYLVATLDGAQMDTILAMVGEIGLPDIVDEVDDSAASMVADAATEVVVYRDDAGEHRLAVYALGLDNPLSPRDSAFLELIATLDQITAETPGEPYQPERVRVVAGEGFVDPAFEDTREWPLETADLDQWAVLPNGWVCTAVSGPVPAVFEDATQATTWTRPDGSGPLTLLVRPLVPGEPDCVV